MPKISVIVPVYNVENYIHRCIDSILAQTFSDFELILVDDGSPDNCPKICDEYAEKDSRINVIHQANGGAAAARNTGIDYALNRTACEWISFVDGDDVIHPMFLETLFYAAIKNFVKMSTVSCVNVPQDYCCNFDNVSIKESITENAEAYWLKKDGRAVSVCHNLYHRDIITDIKFPEGKTGEDIYVAYKLIFSAEKLAVVNTGLYFYFQNSDSTCHTRIDRNFNQPFGYYEQIGYFAENGYPKCERLAIENYMSHLASTLYSLKKRHPDEKQTIKSGKKLLRIAMKKYGNADIVINNKALYKRLAYPTEAKIKKFITKKFRNLLYRIKKH